MVSGEWSRPTGTAPTGGGATELSGFHRLRVTRSGMSGCCENGSYSLSCSLVLSPSGFLGINSVEGYSPGVVKCWAPGAEDRRQLSPVPRAALARSAGQNPCAGSGVISGVLPGGAATPPCERDDTWGRRLRRSTESGTSAPDAVTKRALARMSRCRLTRPRGAAKLLNQLRRVT